MALTAVVKYGGAALKNDSVARRLLAELGALIEAGHEVVLVHGGGPEIDAMLGRLKIQPRREQGLRVTDRQTLEVVEMVLAGRVNKALVSLAAQCGANAAGLSGIDGGMVQAEKLSGEIDFGFVGEINLVRTDLLRAVMSAGFLPIVSSLAAGRDGAHYNINGDDFASALASGLKASAFVLVTDVSGVMRNFPDVSSLIPRLTAGEADELLASGTVASGMIPKLRACRDAVRNGVRSACIIDGSEERVITKILEGKNVKGTFITG
jgi:acetylglutamate kinase